MLRKTFASLIAIVGLIAFFASRQPLTAAQQTNYKELVNKMQSSRLSNEEMRQIVKVGPAALDYILDGFTKSQFARETVKKIEPGFNLGKAMDQNTYARNVVEVADAFGMAGVDRLVKRLRPDIIQGFNLDSKEFRELGTGTIKPLITVELLRNASSKDDNPRIKQWASRFVDYRPTTEIDPRTIRAGFLEGIVDSLVATAVWEGAKWLANRLAQAHTGDIDCLTSYQIRKDVPNSLMLDKLSPATRAKLRLRTLDSPPPFERRR
jgi:hypothetical protein